MNRHLWLASILVALIATGCVVRARPAVGVSATVSSGDYGTTYATVPPPAPIAEYRSPPPGYGYLWVDGYWDWTGYDWAWTQGYWAPERVGYVYIRPQYYFDNGRWAYHRSYWDGPQGRRDYDWGRRGSATSPTVRGSAPGQSYGTYRGNTPQSGYAGPPPRGAYVQPNTAPPPSHGGFSPQTGGVGPGPAHGGFAQPGGAVQPNRGVSGPGIGRPGPAPMSAPTQPPPPASRPGFATPTNPGFNQPVRSAPPPAMTGTSGGGYVPPPARPNAGAAMGNSGFSSGARPMPVRPTPVPAMGARPGPGQGAIRPSTPAPSARPASAPAQGGGNAMRRGAAPR